ncbi:SH3 domain-containing protein [Sphingomonas sp. 7/4-4]|uniref:SH3 domain-containing protein n=1 Tax=Sphingomonas sp. 7/4-4 TaxID=3018446 RepID=UPI0022F3DFD0|nr:SH3 domain-containing protein [Sphingomonas sp. 7/4-4]WBY08146.1 SH3 domain-containing protein [Sphingomonas sp. 7/4-4]
MPAQGAYDDVIEKKVALTGGAISVSFLIGRSLLRALLSLGLMLCATIAQAQDLVVQRDVTVRAEPRSGSDRVDYVTPGTGLDWLENGERQRGYYHVRLADGREGWVYQSFVRRADGTAAVATAAVPGDEAIVHYIDVDQAASALLEFPCGAVLIDAGGRDAQAVDHLIAYLEAFSLGAPISTARSRPCS